MKEKRVAIFVDSRKKSGGAYHELVYTIKKIQELNNNNINFIIVATSKELDLNLEKFNIEICYFSLNPFDRYVAYVRNFSYFVRGIKKFFFFKNKFESFLEEKNIDLVYFVGPSQYSLYLENIKFFINVPDISVRENLEFPELVDNLEFQRKNDIFKKSLPRALAIITNSKIIKKRIAFFYQILESRIFIINHQPSSSISEFTTVDEEKFNSVIKKYKLPNNYFFYPAMYLPHKNHQLLIDAIEELKKESNINQPNLVFCGNDVGYLTNLKKYVEKKNLKERIFFLNFIDDEELPYLYYGSTALVMPSLIGPTNIPPWEAFKLNKPVIYSKLEGIFEVLGDAVHYFDPTSLKDLVDALKKVLNDKIYREELIKKGNMKLIENNKANEFEKFFKIINNYRNIQKKWIF